MNKRYNQLFSDNPPGKTPRLHLGYGTKKRAYESINKLKHQDKTYQKQAATTMYYRAKYHKYQTQGMRNAMKIYGKFLKTLKNTNKK
jgi:hypothetical protein